MEIERFLNSIPIFDLLILGGLFGMFVLGYIQGVIRRLIGIVSVSFAFIVAAQARDPLGDWLSGNWVQYSAGYNRMIAFGLVFVTIAISLALITQFNYKTQMLWPKTPFVEEVVGGLLGVVQGIIILLAVFIIIDPYFRTTGGAAASGELPFLRGFHDAFTGSTTEAIYRSTLIPGFLALFGALIPDTIEAGLKASG
jgi:uncharacterized membrane protein required for colicin V production